MGKHSGTSSLRGSGASLAFLLLSLALFEQCLGPRGTLSAFLATLAFAAAALPLALTSPGTRRTLGLIALAAAGLGVTWAAGGAVRYFAIAATFAALAPAIGGRAPRRAASAQALALTAFLFAVFVTLRDTLPLWTFLAPASVAITTALTSWLPGPLSLGPTYSGVWVLAAALGAVLSHAVLAPPGGGRRHAVAALLVVVAWAAGLCVRAAAAPGAGGHAHDVTIWLSALSARATQFLLMLPPLALLGWHADGSRQEGPEEEAARRRPGPPARSQTRRAVLAIILFVIGLGLLAANRAVAPHRPRVLLDTRGSFSLDPPVWGRYGPDATEGASLATLPRLLAARQFELTRTDTLGSGDLLARHDVLLVMNPPRVYTSAEHEAIWRFVERGGGLLVLGDHTDILGTREPINRLLAPSGVRINFDSAVPLVERWTWYGCLRAHPHPVTRGLCRESAVKWSIGASLDLPPRALPLLTGRDAFADAGNRQNARGAFLGNMSPDRHEQLGDVFLAAEVPYGRGKVIVFGDTSPFQQYSLLTSHELVTRVLLYLGRPGSAVPSFPVRVIGALLLAAGTVVLLRAGQKAWALALAAALAAILLFVIERTAVVGIPGTFHAQVAAIDLAHGNRVDLHSGRDDGVNGLTAHLWRHGFLPIGFTGRVQDATALDSVRVYATVAPAFSFTTAERRVLSDFVAAGGLLMIATGYEERRGAEALLGEFGLAIGPTPLGSAPAATTRLPGQTVRMRAAWPVLDSKNRGQVWVECWDYPIVIYDRSGRGGVLVVGDSRFLCDVQLESSQGFMEANINFLRAAIETALGRAPDVAEPSPGESKPEGGTGS